MDRTLVALLGGLLVVVLGVIDQHEAFAAIDFNVIFLLAGMMVLAGALRKTGFFEFVAGHAIHLSRGDPFRLRVLLADRTVDQSPFDPPPPLLVARTARWVRPELVAEVRYDKVQGNRFRHGTKLIRWRDDKDPKDCTWRELRPPRDPNAPTVDTLLTQGLTL